MSLEIMNKKMFADYVLNNDAVVDNAINLNDFESCMATFKDLPPKFKALLVDMKEYAQDQDPNEEWRVRGIMDLVISLYNTLPDERPIPKEKDSLEAAYFNLFYILNDPSLTARLEEWDIKDDLLNAAYTVQQHLKKPRKTRVSTRSKTKGKKT